MMLELRGSFGLFAEHSGQSFRAAFNAGHLPWLQGDQVCVFQPVIPQEDREHLEQIRIAELVDSIHSLAAFGKVGF